ncbi:F-actin-monooxygenase MICAL2-like [Tiliqua scincoides]|uniref:F-actin-monooxygenase MICAL2-like n=1 Tax=Tiliqua scincoides TaxID=71010 RepID=UPI0034629420
MDYYYHKIDEPISPKKLKNVPETDFKGRCSSVSSEWASVRVFPEEEMTEHNLLAVRVMVTSDGSSSEQECDSSTSEFNKGPLPLLEPRRYIPSLQRPLFSNTHLVKGEDCCTKSRVANALQRAQSLRDSSALKKYQNWKKKIQSNFLPLYNKKNEPSSRESIQSDLEDDLFQTELTSPNKIANAPRGHFKLQSPAFQRKEKATDVYGEIPTYVPHFSLHNSTDIYHPLVRSKTFHYGSVAATPYYTKRGDEDPGVKKQDVKKPTVNSEQLTSGLFIKNSETFSVKPDAGDGTTSTSTKEQHDKHLNKAKKKIMRKLSLTMEQQSNLLSLNDVKLVGTSTEQQGQGIPEQKNVYFNRYGNIPKKPDRRSLKFSDNHLPILSPEPKFPKNAGNCPKEHITGLPKTPLRLIASAIKRSLIEPLMPPPEGLKKGQDTHAKSPSESTFLNCPHTFVRSVSLRNSKNQGEYDLQLQEPKKLGSAEKGLQIRSSERSNFPSNPKADHDTHTSFPVYSVHSSSSKNPYKTEYASYTHMDDVPTLLEKFTLKENLWKSTRGDLCSHNQKNNHYSSLRLGNKSPDGGPVQRNNIRNLFSNFRNKLDDRDDKPFLVPMPSCTIFDVDKVLTNSSNGDYVGSEHLPVRKQVTDYCSSSSSEGELEHKASLPRKTKRILKRNRKLEKETKQLVKQEELKRLHKAQAIQRLLEEVEEKQRALEVHGVQLERELRGESDSSTQDETQLLHEWFELVLEKNKLMRYESELLIMAKELESEDHQS